MKTEAANLEHDYPSIPLAYQIAVNSYEVLTKRLDVLDGRIQSFVTVSVTITAAFVSLAGARGESFASVWLWAAGVLFALGMIAGSAIRFIGAIRVLDPVEMWKSWLHQEPLEFQKNVIFETQKAFTQNLALAFLRQRYLAALTGLLGLEVICLVAWVYQ